MATRQHRRKRPVHPGAVAVLAALALLAGCGVLTLADGGTGDLEVGHDPAITTPGPATADGSAAPTSASTPPTTAGSTTASTTAPSGPKPSTAGSHSGEPSSAGPTRAHVGRAAPSQVHGQRPQRLVLAPGVSVPVQVAATGPDGLLQLPSDVRRAGWWDGSARIGDPLGSIVIAAHVDSLSDGLGAFAKLLSTQPGDRLELSSAGLREDFRVSLAHLKSKASLSASSRLYSAATSSRLVLITCAGPFDPAAGGYQDNFIVVAEPVGPPTKRRIS